MQGLEHCQTNNAIAVNDAMYCVHLTMNCRWSECNYTFITLLRYTIVCNSVLYFHSQHYCLVFIWLIHVDVWWLPSSLDALAEYVPRLKNLYGKVCTGPIIVFDDKNVWITPATIKSVTVFDTLYRMKFTNDTILDRLICVYFWCWLSIRSCDSNIAIITGIVIIYI